MGRPVKRIALLKSGVVVNLAAWDGASAWDPVAAGQCDSTVDVTLQPAVQIGWTYANGSFAAVSPPVTPDPAGFMLAIFGDGSIPIATRNALVPWKTAIQDYISQPALIASAWNDLVASLAISAANQAAIHGYAVQHGIPGI